MISKLQKEGMRKALKELNREDLELYCYVQSVNLGLLIDQLSDGKGDEIDGFLGSVSETGLTQEEARRITPVSMKVQDVVIAHVRSHN